MRVLSWNLLTWVGAGVDDICRLVEAHRPDLVLLQEATSSIDVLPDCLGGHYVRKPMSRRSHGLAAWSPHPFIPVSIILPSATRFDLPVPVFRLMAPRLALVVELDGYEIANVHLDHGQLANRRQLGHLLESRPGLDAVIGDYNALGMTRLPGFRDVGPRRATHLAYGVVPVRIDRCLVRGLHATNVAVLARGASDHRPILIDLARSRMVTDKNSARSHLR